MLYKKNSQGFICCIFFSHFTKSLGFQACQGWLDECFFFLSIWWEFYAVFTQQYCRRKPYIALGKPETNSNGFHLHIKYVWSLPLIVSGIKRDKLVCCQNWSSWQTSGLAWSENILNPFFVFWMETSGAQSSVASVCFLLKAEWNCVNWLPFSSLFCKIVRPHLFNLAGAIAGLIERLITRQIDLPCLDFYSVAETFIPTLTQPIRTDEQHIGSAAFIALSVK